MRPHMDDISTLLWCTDSDLKAFREKASKPEERITDQDLSNVVENLIRREHALERSLAKELHQNQKYRMPENWIQDIQEQIDFFQTDTQVRAKVEAVAGQQAIFYGLLSRIHEVILKPHEVVIKAPKIKLDVSKTETDDSHSGG